jgi:hypothetical protein
MKKLYQLNFKSSNWRKIFILVLWLIFIVIIAYPQIAKAEIKFFPQIKIPGFEETEIKEGTLAHYISSFYKWSVTVVAILAVIMIMISGLQWIFSAGNPPAIAKAKDQMMSAILGLILVLICIPLLEMINPALVRLSSFEIPEIVGEGEKQELFVFSEILGGAGPEENIFVSQGDWTGYLVITMSLREKPKDGKTPELVEMEYKGKKGLTKVIPPPSIGEPWVTTFKKGKWGWKEGWGRECLPKGTKLDGGDILASLGESGFCWKVDTEEFIKTAKEEDPFYKPGKYKIENLIKYKGKTYPVSVSVYVAEVGKLGTPPSKCLCVLSEGEYKACETRIDKDKKFCMSKSPTGGVVINDCRLGIRSVGEGCQSPKSCTPTLKEQRPFYIGNPVYNGYRVDCTSDPKTPKGCIQESECRP